MSGSPQGTPVAGASRGAFAAEVLANDPICREHFRLRLVVPEHFPSSEPGQFVQLLCRPSAGSVNAVAAIGETTTWRIPVTGDGEKTCQPELRQPLALLRRPFSIADRVEEPSLSTTGASRGASRCVIDVVHRVVGVGTDWLAALRGGDVADLIGPLGKSFDLSAADGLFLLVGGGVGLPPMFYAARELCRRGHDAVAFVGAMTRDLLAVDLDDAVPPDTEGRPTACARPFLSQGYATVVTTDDGSCGMQGTIVDGLRAHLARMTGPERGRCQVLTCGPTGMMHAAAQAAAEAGVGCQVCLEQAMACGMATCQSCVVPIETPRSPQGMTADGRAWRYRLACTDGPVFPASEVIWEMMT